MRHITKNADEQSSIRGSRFFFPLAAIAAAIVAQGCAADVGAEPTAEATGSDEQAWDSQDGNPTHATHSYLTEYAIDQLKGLYPELQTYRADIVDGANRELHELPITSNSDSRTSVAELEALRVEAEGTNASCLHPERTWARAQSEYRAGNKAKAYWLTGIVLHWVEDMGVPAHAFGVIHQGTLSQRDNLEALALFTPWGPDFSPITPRIDPIYTSPAPYLAVDGAWARSDFNTAYPGVTYTRTFFSSSWLWASSKEMSFLKKREGAAATVTKWALHSAVTHF